MRFAFVTVVACVALSSLTTAHARPRSQASQLSPDCNLMMACQTPSSSGTAGYPEFGMFNLPAEAESLSPRARRATARAERRAARVAARNATRQTRSDLRNAMAYAPPVTEEPAKDSAITYDAPAAAEQVERESVVRTATSIKGIVPGLASKVAQIQSSCPGAQVISSVRHTRIRGTRRMSLHATGEAVDMRGNPSCVYAQLRDWPGGYSTDYGRAKHIHISLSSSGREMGLRFAHGGHRSHRHRRMAMR